MQLFYLHKLFCNNDLELLYKKLFHMIGIKRKMNGYNFDRKHKRKLRIDLIFLREFGEDFLDVVDKKKKGGN